MPSTLDDLAGLVATRLPPAGPHLVGLAGAVAVGKSTIARELAARLDSGGRHVDVVPTDAFLQPNTLLAERDLLYRKGFPESFDTDALGAFVRDVKAGAQILTIPVYSHVEYDIEPDRTATLRDPDVVILEGVLALQPPAVDSLDVAIYVDAAEADVRSWFCDRFLTLVAQARTEAAAFYRMFADMNDEQVRSVAEGTWDAINGPNLSEHIAPSRANASIVVRKNGDHTIARIASLT